MLNHFYRGTLHGEKHFVTDMLQQLPPQVKFFMTTVNSFQTKNVYTRDRVAMTETQCEKGDVNRLRNFFVSMNGELTELYAIQLKNSLRLTSLARYVILTSPCYMCWNPLQSSMHYTCKVRIQAIVQWWSVCMRETYPALDHAESGSNVLGGWGSLGELNAQAQQLSNESPCKFRA